MAREDRPDVKGDIDALETLLDSRGWAIVEEILEEYQATYMGLLRQEPGVPYMVGRQQGRLDGLEIATSIPRRRILELREEVKK